MLYDIHDKDTLFWLQLIWLRGAIYCYMFNCFLIVLPYSSIMLICLKMILGDAIDT